MARVVLQELGKDFVGPRGDVTSAVRQVNLTVEDGELLVVVGPSGSGKTTLLRLIAGLEEPTRGTLLLDGAVANGVAPQDRDIAMVFQHHALYPHLTVRENLALGLRLRRCPRAEIEQRIAGTAALLGLTTLLERLPRALSGGERQRVAIGRAVVRRPRVFLFDEPLAFLDAPLRTQLRSEIAQLQQHVRATLIYVTHDQAEALALGRRIAVMNRGTVEQCAEPRELYQRPANLFVAGFIGSPAMNLLSGTLAGDGGELVFHDEVTGWICRIHPARLERLRAHVGKTVILGLRPEHLTVSSPGEGQTAVGALSATVESLETTGPESILRLSAKGRTLLARVPADAGWILGQVLSVTFDTCAASFFDPASRQLVD
jgi:multiple sugar transport system ATP-binding protein